MVNVAMIGAGGYAFELIKRTFNEPRSLNLIAVSSNPARKSLGRDFCEKRDIPVYPDMDTLLVNVKDKAKVIIIPTSIDTHFSISKKCIDAGFDVFLEKPPVATIQEIDNLISYAKHNNKDIAVMFQYLYTDIVKKMKDRLVSGEFGRVKRVRAMAGWPRLDSYYNRAGWAGRLKINDNWVLDGTINNPLAHMLANQLYFASMRPGMMAEPVTIEAELYHGHEIESEDTSSLRIITSDNVEIIFCATLCSFAEINPVTIIDCEKAIITYSNFNKAKIKYINDAKTETIVDEFEQRTYMLNILANCYKTRMPYPASLEVCRSFTLAINGAFESCGKPHGIDKSHISIFESGDSIKTVINGIDDVLRVCFNNGRLFSEMGIDWARKSAIFNLNSYSSFPSVGSVYSKQ